MLSKTKNVVVKLSVLLVLCDCATSLIIPEELPTILSLIYSNIPPIKKGTDSRIGVGFRLGQHADVQVLFEIGPQTETDPIGSNVSKKRRDAMYSAAMRGELGPLAQAIAKYQTERKIEKDLERLKRIEGKIKKINAEKESDVKKTNASEWLTNWSKGVLSTSSEDQTPLEQVPLQRITVNVADAKNKQRTDRPVSEINERIKMEELKKMYKVEKESKNISIHNETIKN